MYATGAFAMPPRRRAAAAASGAASWCTIAALPDHLLLQCLANLTQQERFQHACLVSKRFQSLCLAPPLLRTVKVSIAASSAAPLQRAEALLAFLVQHGRHVMSLRLDIEPLKEDEEDEEEGQGEQQRQQWAIMASCLAACGTAGCLEELTVTPRTPLAATAWLAGLSATLRRLEIGSEDVPLVLPSSISRLTRLEDASLMGAGINLARVCLPASLTRLHVYDDESAALPPQVTRLTRLQRLELESTRYDVPSLQALSALRSVTQLELKLTTELPLFLSATTGLRRLVVTLSSEHHHPLLHAALPRLTGLTSLLLFYEAAQERFPEAIASLPRLQRLWLYPGEGAVEDPALPGGRWLASIRWLGLPWLMLRAGAGVLSGAPQLEYLCSLDVPVRDESGYPGAWGAFWALAATHGPLRCLAIDVNEASEDDLSIALLDALFRLKHRRPGLQLRRTDTSWEEFNSCLDIPVEPCEGS